jgi:DNA-binding transcriptional MerR regulator
MVIAEVTMKDWLTIGQFAKKLKMSSRALRIYEGLGLLKPYYRGENQYRYYKVTQLEVGREILHYKAIGFSLQEIKALINHDPLEKLIFFEQLLKTRLSKITTTETSIQLQKSMVQQTLTSLEEFKPKTIKKRKKVTMQKTESIMIIVCGIRDLEGTANIIHNCFKMNGIDLPIISCKEYFDKNAIPDAGSTPLLLIVQERELTNSQLKTLNPDVIIINNISTFSTEAINNYLNLYEQAGSHMMTVFNADDCISLQLAAEQQVRKGATYYYSKNKGLEAQIMNIGGVISNGHEILAHTGHFNGPKKINCKFKNVLSLNNEVNILAALTATMDIGLEDKNFYKFWDSEFLELDT